MVETLVGVNAPYLRGAYGHDLAPSGRHPDWPVEFDPMVAYRPIIEAATLGFGAVRVWLCEAAEGLVFEGDTLVGVHEDLLESIRVFQEAAALHGVRLYWSLLDGNAVGREGDVCTRRVLTDPDTRARFAEKVVVPIVAALDPATTFALEIVNEPETATVDCMRDSDEVTADAVPVAWEDLGATIRTAGDAARAEQSGLWVTAGTMHVFLPALLAAEPQLGAIDVHVYHPRGGMPSRADLNEYTKGAVGDRPLIGGELGIPKAADEGEPFALTNYVFNARSLGYAAAFLWQLEGDLVDHRAPKRAFTELGWETQRVLTRASGST